MKKIKDIRSGQVWRSKTTNHSILVNKKSRDDWWYVCPFNINTQTISKNKGHKMQSGSFHFYELVESI